MDQRQLQQMAAAVSYIEARLDRAPVLEEVARAARYSKYHLHRLFTEAAGVTPHGYLRRRQLTEAARLLVFTRTPLAQIALATGWESQQSFTTAFRAMYKRTPLAYRDQGVFYPLQLEWKPDPGLPEEPPREVSPAAPEDLPRWMDFTGLVIGGFPCLDRDAHREQAKEAIGTGQAVVLRAGGVLAGAAAFSRREGTIEFLAVHPRYRRRGVERLLLDHLLEGPLAGRQVSITTFRAGDKADTGQRAAYQGLGFLEAEPLAQFGYPAQRLILPPGREAVPHG